MDGVSLTHGNPRQHIWTFGAGLDEVATFPQYNCPCTHTPTASQATPPPALIFVGNDYFCDTGSANQCQHVFYPDNPLWGRGWVWASEHMLLLQQPSMVLQAAATAHHRRHRDEVVYRSRWYSDEGMVVEMVDIFII